MTRMTTMSHSFIFLEKKNNNNNNYNKNIVKLSLISLNKNNV